MDDEQEIEYQYVMGLDPGGTTGVAMLRYTAETPPELIYLHQITDGKEGFFDWFRGSELSDNVTVVSEKWVERNVKGADRTPLVIEGVQYALWQDEVVYQTPDMKSIVSDDWLKEQNLWTPDRRHQMDALIHAIVYLRNQDHKPTQDALQGEAKDTLAEEGEAQEKQLQEGEQAPSGDATVDALMEAIKELQKAAQEASDAMQELSGTELQTPDETVNDTEIPDHETGDKGYTWEDPDITDKRKKREKNGAFAGFQPPEEDIVEEIVIDWD